ncbi:MAG: FAD-dependent oxidoreductase [Chloroflexi bacterium]|nr:MAG: FAD-dependent oxidoreductase [Chloroflexota bacterium]
MPGLPKHARAVVIGSGIVGNSVAYHLARLGWRDLVLLDKGPLPNPGGSTGHASNFIYLVDHSKEMTALTVESVRQYQELEVFTQSGGIEVARTHERMQELTRRLASGRSWGIEPTSLVSPAEIKQLVPYINETILLGGFYTPGVGVVDSLRAGTLMRERAVSSGALHVSANTEVIGLDVKQGRISCVRTTGGDIETDCVVVACGVWSPRVGRMAGADIPLTPAVHQMIDVGPVPQFASAKSDIEFPIVRDMDTNMYERQAGGDLEIGSYAHRPILYDPEDLPSVAQAALSPTEFPFTQADFQPQMEHALELMPEIVGNERVGVKYAINGILSLTPDGMPVLGESSDVHGLWSAAAVWVKEGPGTGKTLAEWMVHGESEIDVHASDAARFHEHQKTRKHVRSRAAEGFNKTYGIVHPNEQWATNRNVRLAPFHERERELQAFFFEAAGWERPMWYESNASLLDEFGDQVTRRTSEWESRWWSPIINAEHLAMRERAGIFDLSAFTIFDITGPGALTSVQSVTLRQMDVPVGRNVYTPVLSPAGGFKSDLTIMRLGEDHFRVVTGGASGMSDKKWFRDHLPADGSAQLQDLTSSMTTIGLWGPRARDILSAATAHDVSNDGFKFGTCRWIDVGAVRVLASRISYVGDLGLEKCYRAHGNELETEYNVVEAGMSAPRVKAEDFVGKEAHLRHRVEDPAAILCTLTVDDHTSKSGEKRYMLGREPILTPDGKRIVDRKGRGSYVTSAGAGPSVGKHVLMAYLPPERASTGEKLEVEYMGERYPIAVAVVGSTPLFDPENLRVKA